MKSVLLVVALVLIAVPALGQSFGANIGGTVSDESAAVMSGATVTIVHALNGRTVVSTTGERGDYRVGALQPGDYDVSVEQSGFAPVRRPVTLLVGADATMDFTRRSQRALG